MKSINQLWTMRVIAIWFSNTNLVFTAERVEGHDADPDTGHKDKLYVVKAPKDSNSIPLSKGQLWKVTGDYEGAPENLNFRSGKIRKRYTIRAVNMRCLMPNTGEEFKRYVSESPDFKGIGAQKAEVIWSKLGQDVFRYAYENDLSKFDFLTPKMAKLFVKCCKQYSTLEHAEWLRECGFKTSTINKIVTFHGIDSIKAIKANPYVAITLGMSFNEIDALAQNPKTFNITSQCDERRLVAALEYVVQKELEKGHTVSDEKILYKSLRSLLKNQSLAFESLRLVHKASQVRKSEFGFHATAPLIMEHFIAVELLHLKSQASSWSSEMERAFNLAQKDLPFELTAKQKEAVKTGMSSGVFILTGGAGTGKTTVLRVLFKALNQNGYKVYPMALAGRAAECIRATTGYLSQTIHGALIKGDMKAGDKSVVVIDEASMVDISLLFRLLRKIPENTRIIFVGDPYQLPPIGYGLALHDFIKAKCLPTVELDIVKRSSEDSGIPEYTKLIRHGLTPADLTMGNVTFYNTPRQLFSKKAVELMAEACGNATVVAGSNTRVTEINRATQFSINPHGAPILESEEGDFVGDCKITLRKGDPVVFNKNFWDEGVQNGTMGVLDSVSRVNDIFGEVTLLDGSKVAITEPLLQSLSASYCITVHKAQGSQFDRVVVVVDTSRIVDRSWIYTALTRAKNKVDIISTEEIFTEAIKAHPTFQKRRTFLWYLLNNPDFKTMP